jgi:hypothetical protein
MVYTVEVVISTDEVIVELDHLVNKLVSEVGVVAGSKVAEVV